MKFSLHAVGAALAARFAPRHQQDAVAASMLGAAPSPVPAPPVETVAPTTPPTPPAPPDKESP